MLLALLIAAAWLGVVAFAVIICRAAAAADRPDDTIGQPSERARRWSSIPGLVVWDEPSQATARPAPECAPRHHVVWRPRVRVRRDDARIAAHR